jgi:hypothetical protein
MMDDDASMIHLILPTLLHRCVVRKLPLVRPGWDVKLATSGTGWCVTREKRVGQHERMK